VTLPVVALVIALAATACAPTRTAAAHIDRARLTAPTSASTAKGRATTSTTNRATTPSLVIEASTETRVTDNFNPFRTSSPLGRMGVPSYIYEPLVEYNELQVDQYYPWLASSWSFSSSGLTITFNLRARVRWDDGARFTASDVAYTFNLLKDNPDIDDGIPIVSAVASSPTIFTLTLSEPGYAYLYDIARVPIVKSGYATGVDPLAYLDKSPDGTGPYTLAHASDLTTTRVVLTARPGYWQGQAPVRNLIFPAYPDNASVLAALRAGTLDWASNQLTDVEADYVDKDRESNHFWSPPVDCVALELNLAVGDLDRVAVRRAISAAIDRDTLSDQAEGGVLPVATSASGLVLPTDNQFLVPSDTTDLEPGSDPTAVTSLMRAAGYHLGANGDWTSAAGEPISVNIEDPAGTAFAAAAALVAQQLSAAGFDASSSALPTRRWRSDLVDGDFEGAIVAGATGPSPYFMYIDWLDPSLIVHGRASGGDFERLSSTTAPSAAAAVRTDLDAYTDSPSDSPAGVAAIKAMAELVATDLPVIPLMYGVAWGEFSTRHVSGWPDSQNPFEPAVPRAPFAEYTVLQLSPASP
jgi:peptide/nickel transport system substrate-binding protein